MKQPSPEVFLEACGAHAPLALEIERRDRTEIVRHALSLPFAVVGRDERADLLLDDDEVSHRHAYLQLIAGRLWFVDLDSRTGTFGRRGRQAAGLLDHRHPIDIGPFTLRHAEGGTDEEKTDARFNPLSQNYGDDEALSRVGLEFLEGTDERTLWPVDRPLTLIGRASTCKVRLHSSAVSRMHCALLNTAGGLWAIDLLGREGTRVNGSAVRWALLEEADELRAGPFLMRVCRLDSSSRTPPALEHRLPETGGIGNSLLAPSAPLAPASALAPAAGSEVLLPLVTQFSLMQQQMFEQFQQTLLMVARMFGDLHREQMQLVRQELERVQEITRELQGLQLELSRQPTAAARPAPEPAPPPQATPQAVPSFPTVPPSPPITPAPPTPSTADAGQPEIGVHAWLSQRLATLQEERQSRWQKILSALIGK